MDGRDKRIRTEGPSPPKLQALERLIESLKATNQQDISAAGDAQDLDGLVAEVLKLQRQLRGTAAQTILDEAINQILRKLEAATEALQAVVDRYTPPDSYRPPAAGGEAYVRDIIAYAHKLSYTTFAPPGFVPGQTALRHFKPPAPQDFQLRSSLLHQFQRNYAARQEQAKLVAAGAAGAAAQMLTQAQALGPPAVTAAAEAPPAEVPAAPTASIADLLKKLPPMPPGWKPGDPIPIPGTAAEEATEAERAPPPPPKEAVQPEPSSEEEEPEEGLGKPQRPLLSSAFGLALNPDYELADSSSEDESDDDDSE